MNNKFPIYLAKVETSPDGVRKFVKNKKPQRWEVWGTPYNKFFFKLRKAYFTKPNCNLNCPPNKEFFCCKTMGCMKNCGYFEWNEVPFFTDEEREEILSLWDNGTGFHREYGCVLPRELRSYVCLSWACRHSKEE